MILSLSSFSRCEPNGLNIYVLIRFCAFQQHHGNARSLVRCWKLMRACAPRLFKLLFFDGYCISLYVAFCYDDIDYTALTIRLNLIVFHTYTLEQQKHELECEIMWLASIYRPLFLQAHPMQPLVTCNNINLTTILFDLFPSEMYFREYAKLTMITMMMFAYQSSNGISPSNSLKKLFSLSFFLLFICIRLYKEFRSVPEIISGTNCGNLAFAEYFLCDSSVRGNSNALKSWNEFDRIEIAAKWLKLFKQSNFENNKFKCEIQSVLIGIYTFIGWNDFDSIILELQKCSMRPSFAYVRSLLKISF